MQRTPDRAGARHAPRRRTPGGAAARWLALALAAGVAACGGASHAPGQVDTRVVCQGVVCTASDACHVPACDAVTGACSNLLKTSLVEVRTTGGPVFANGGSCLAATATSGAAGSLTFAAEPGTYTCTIATAGTLAGSPTPALGTPFACAPGGAIAFSGYSDLGLEGRPYTLTVAGTDARGKPSTAALVWNVDTTPPQVGIQVTSTQNTGAATITLTANEAASASCTLDGATLPCGPIAALDGGFVATAVARELAVGSHDIAATATDSFGNGSGASPATASFAVTFGPNQGRAILIGHGCLTGGEPTEILRRAVNEVPWKNPSLGYARKIRLATFVGASAGWESLAHMAIAGLYDPDSAALISTTDPAELAAKLKTRDVLLVPVQEDAATSAAAGESWRAALSTFLAQGGVVVVQDGAPCYDPFIASPYLTHRVLSQSPAAGEPLLGVGIASDVPFDAPVAKTLTATELMRTSDASPLAANPGGPFEYAAGNGTVTYTVADAGQPRFVYEAGGYPVVLEKIFPAYAVSATLTATGAALTGAVPAGAQIDWAIDPPLDYLMRFSSMHCAWVKTDGCTVGVSCPSNTCGTSGGRFLTPGSAGTYRMSIRLTDPRGRPGNAYRSVITVSP